MPKCCRVTTQLALLFMLGACTAAPVARVRQAQRGDTLVVTYTGDGTWGPARDAVEEARVSGASTEAPFVQVNSALVLPDGGVLVVDAKPIDDKPVKRFDAAGHFVNSIGRVGSGPGEYKSIVVVSLAAGADSTFYMLDSPNGRVNHFVVDGRALPAIALGNSYANGPWQYLRAGVHKSVMVWSMVVAGPHSYRDASGYIRYDSVGNAVDSIQPPRGWFAPGAPQRFAPTEEWWALSDGRVLLFRTDRAGFFIKPARGDTGMRLVELAVEPAPIGPDERRELQAESDFSDAQLTNEDGSAVSRLPIPEHKPAIRGVIEDLDGRIWMQRHVPSVKVPTRTLPYGPNLTRSYDEPVTWCAFTSSGEYLGEVRFPPRVRLIGVHRDIAWVIAHDDDDAVQLIRYRIPGIGAQ